MHSTKLRLCIASHPAEGHIGENKSTVAINDGHANGGVIEGGAKSAIAFRQLDCAQGRFHFGTYRTLF
jgi:hypothetical protein